MPTGYTAAVQSGEITTLRDFALTCSRAFGALIMMRDEPMSTPIPDRFEPSTDYHDKAIAAAQTKLAEIALLNGDECDKRAADEFEVSLNAYVKRENERKQELARYNYMLDQVNAWQVTDKLRELRKFMIEQLNESIKFDCGYIDNKPVRLTGEDWKKKEMEEASRDLAYHIPQRDDEIRRTEERNKWLRELRTALE